MVGVAVAASGRSGAVAVGRNAGVDAAGAGVDALTIVDGVTMVGCGVITSPQAVNIISAVARKTHRMKDVPGSSIVFSPLRFTVYVLDYTTSTATR